MEFNRSVGRSLEYIKNGKEVPEDQWNNLIFFMALSCIIIANLPTYEEIGITASCVMLVCRIIQGITSMRK